MPKKGYITVKGKNPSGKGEREFKISERRLQNVLKGATHHKFLDAYLIKEVMESPILIFKGLERTNQWKGLCYIGKPENRYHDQNTTTPFPPGFLFMVFIDENSIIFDWRVEKCDPVNHKYPEKAQSRFSEQLWPTSSNI